MKTEKLQKDVDGMKEMLRKTLNPSIEELELELKKTKLKRQIAEEKKKARAVNTRGGAWSGESPFNFSMRK